MDGAPGTRQWQNDRLEQTTAKEADSLAGMTNKKYNCKNKSYGLGRERFTSHP
jgi:hypothetical protein